MSIKRTRFFKIIFLILFLNFVAWNSRAGFFSWCNKLLKPRVKVTEIEWPESFKTYSNDPETLFYEGEFQRAIWKTQEKAPHLALEFEEKIERLIKSATQFKEVSDLTYGTSFKRLVEATIPVNGKNIKILLVFKVFNFKNEIAAYRLSKFLGLNLVPVTTELKVLGHTGSVQLFIDNAKNGLELGFDGFGSHGSASLEIFDYLVGNIDRGRYMNEGNFLFTLDERRLVAIDHAECFTATPQLANLNPRFYYKNFDDSAKKLLEKIAKLNKQELIALLGDLLDTRAIASILIRKKKLLEYFKKVEGFEPGI
jgi:hypothetical protein